MKLIWISALNFFLMTSVAFVHATSPTRPSIIKSIDDLPLPSSSSEASEEALPQEEIESLRSDPFTVLSPSRVSQLFNTLKHDS